MSGARADAGSSIGLAPGDCPACGGALAAYFRLRANGLRTSRCGACGLVLVVNSPINAGNIAEFYSMAAYRGERDLQDTDLYSGYYSNCFAGYDPDDLTVRQFRGIVGHVRRLLGEPRGPRTLLDVGCATGVLLDLARAAGFEVRGVEVSPELAGYARTNFRLEVDGDLLAAGYPDASFDAVTLTDVIEHLPESILRTMVAEIARVLRPGGILVVRTPGEDGFLRASARALFFGSCGRIEAPMHLFYSYEHLVNFTPRALASLFGPHALAPVQSLREEENPARLNIGGVGRAVLRFSYLPSAALGRQHKLVEYYRREAAAR